MRGGLLAHAAINHNRSLFHVFCSFRPGAATWNTDEPGAPGTAPMPAQKKVRSFCWLAECAECLAWCGGGNQIRLD